MTFATTDAAHSPLMTGFACNDEGIPVLFFGTLPFPMPVLFGSPMVAPVPNTSSMTAVEEDEGDEPCFVITHKGKENKILSFPIKPQRSRKRCYKKKAPSTYQRDPALVVPFKVSKKQALQTYQEELVAHSSLPVNNSFTPLRIVRKNSPTANIRSVWEIPQTRPTSSDTQLRRTVSDPIRVTNPAIAIHEAHRTLRQKKQQQRNWYQTRRAATHGRHVSNPRESRTQAQSQIVLVKSRLTYPEESRVIINPHPLRPRPARQARRTRSDSGVSRVSRRHIPRKGKPIVNTDLAPNKKENGSMFSGLGAQGTPWP